MSWLPSVGANHITLDKYYVSSTSYVINEIALKINQYTWNLKYIKFNLKKFQCETMYVLVEYVFVCIFICIGRGGTYIAMKNKYLRIHEYKKKYI